MQVISKTGKRLGKSMIIQGKRQNLTICRQIYRLEPDAPWPPTRVAALTPEQPEASKDARKSGRKGRKAAATCAAGASTSAVTLGVEGGTQVFCEELQASKGNTFDFAAVGEPVRKVGRYGAIQILKYFPRNFLNENL